jgi:outer membrane protein assembly factor BamB
VFRLRPRVGILISIAYYDRALFRDLIGLSEVESSMQAFRTVGLAWMMVLAMSPVAWGQEWTRFRGPNGAGISDATTVPAAWTEQDYNWKVKLPASGHSSPVLWGDLIFLSGADEKTAERSVFALNSKDGKVVWSNTYASTFHNKHNLNSFASPTAVCDAELVYFTWSSPEYGTGAHSRQ